MKEALTLKDHLGRDAAARGHGRRKVFMKYASKDNFIKCSGNFIGNDVTCVRIEEYDTVILPCIVDYAEGKIEYDSLGELLTFEEFVNNYNDIQLATEYRKLRSKE